MAKLYTDEVKALIEAAKAEALMDETQGDSVTREMNIAYNHGVKVMESAILFALSHHDYQELVEHDQR